MNMFHVGDFVSKSVHYYSSPPALYLFQNSLDIEIRIEKVFNSIQIFVKKNMN